MTHGIGERGPRTLQARNQVADWLDGISKRVPVAAVKWLEAKSRSAHAKKNRCKRRRNPRRGVVIGEHAESITYQGGRGKGKRSRWRHPFERDSHAQVIGMPDGSIKIKSKAGKRLWDFFEVD